MINLKNDIDIKGIFEAGKIVRKTLGELSELCRPGVRTIELDELSNAIAHSVNAVPAFKDYHGFPYSVCISINEEVVHGFPSQRKIVEGDIVSIDYGIYYNGYYADSAVTIPVGKVSDDAMRLINATRESLKIGILNAVKGNTLNDISKSIEDYILKNHYSVVRDFVGHGVGFKLHEDPQVPNYFVKENSNIKLENGMVLAIEPMVNEKGYKVKIKKNGWTVATRDKSLSAHFEHTVAILENGPLILT